MDIFIGIIVLIIMGLFTYVGAVVSEEKRQKKLIPLLWEKEFWK